MVYIDHGKAIRESRWREEQVSQLPQCLREKFKRVDLIESGRNLKESLENLRRFQEVSLEVSIGDVCQYRAA